MKKQIITESGVSIAVINSEEPVITDGRTAMDIIADVYYTDGCDCMILNKESLTENFFALGSGVAGEVLQKFVNFSMKVAITGDFSGYKSKALKDFIYESNRGNSVFFVPSMQDGVEKLVKKGNI